MTNEEFFDEPVSVVAAMDDEGNLRPQRVTWQNRQYRITAVGRQWDEADGRHVLAEAAGGVRFELQLRREDFVWRIRRVWRALGVA
ncbi:MAG: hypothetical protein HYR94_01860 [Chloroflexi bacterium]|nr:hypothetical protein [Chloroflexota bacterium]